LLKKIHSPLGIIFLTLLLDKLGENIGTLKIPLEELTEFTKESRFSVLKNKNYLRKMEKKSGAVCV
jgi:hypothetical protein